jgi:REP-associated tyrosine transposase
MQHKPTKRRRRPLPVQLRLHARSKSGRGGYRERAGRPKKPGAGMSHLRRPVFERRLPVHVTLRMQRHVYNLRSRRCYAALERAFLAGGSRFGLRLTGFSIQGNHIHMLVEALDHRALSRGIQGLSIRMAKGLNRVMRRRGPVFADRYHGHVLRTPTETARAINYVRENARKHAAARGEIYSPGYVDPYSSAAHPEVVRVAETWMLREGWRLGNRPRGRPA